MEGQPFIALFILADHPWTRTSARISYTHPGNYPKVKHHQSTPRTLTMTFNPRTTHILYLYFHPLIINQCINGLNTTISMWTLCPLLWIWWPRDRGAANKFDTVNRQTPNNFACPGRQPSTLKEIQVTGEKYETFLHQILVQSLLWERKFLRSNRMYQRVSWVLT